MKKIPKECEETLAKVNDRVLEWSRRRLIAYETGGGIAVAVELMRKTSKKKPIPEPWETIHVANGLTADQANAVLHAMRNFYTGERILFAKRKRVAESKAKAKENKQ